MKDKYSHEFVCSKFKEIGYTLLTKKYVNSDQQLDYMCSKGHTGHMRINHLFEGRRCFQCKKDKSHAGVRYTIEEVRKIVESRNYILLSQKYVNKNSKIEILCPQGHSTNLYFSNFLQGGGCKICGYNKIAKERAHSFEYVKSIFLEKGYTLLVQVYKNSNEKLKCVCKKGHFSEISLNAVKNKKFCHECQKKPKAFPQRVKKSYTYRDIKNIFEKRNLYLISTNYINSGSPLKYRCGVCNYFGETTLENINDKRKKYFCINCYHKSIQGSGSATWKHELTDEDRMHTRKYDAYHKWRKSVFSRDSYVCQISGKTGKIVAHHIESYSKNKEIRTSVENGITMLEALHKEFHKIYGKITNNQQLTEFIFHYEQQEKKHA